MDVSGQESLDTPAFLQLCLDDEVVEEFELCSPVVSLGRSAECDIVVDSAAVAGFHAVLSQRAGKLLVEDAASSRGVTRAGVKPLAVELAPGDSVEIGGSYSMRLVASPSGRPRAVQSTLQPALDSNVRFSPPALAGLSPAVRPAYLTLNTDKRETWIVRLDRPAVTIGGARVADIRISGWFTPASIAVVEQRDDGSYLVVEPGREMEVDGRRIVDEIRLTEGTRFRVRELCGVFHERVGIPH